MPKQLTIQRLKELWPLRQEIFKKKETLDIVERFDFVSELIDEILNNEVTIDQNKVFIEGEEIKRKNGQSPTIGYFGPAKDDMPAKGAFNGVKKMMDDLSDFETWIEEIGCLLGGFDINNKEVRKEFRIVSNARTNKKESDNLEKGRPQGPSSNFADNNYFFNIMQALQQMKRSEFNSSNINIALLHPDKTDGNKGRQIEILQTRFPLKFFFMWANKDEVLHPVSLMAFQGLVSSTDEVLDFHGAENEEFNKFSEDWKKYSKKLFNKIIGKDDPDQQEVSDLSKLISIMSLRNLEGTNFYDLLKAGNKAMILTGPPGTGKTRRAKKNANLIVSNGNDSGEDKEGRVNIIDKANIKLVQFHPAYNYDDFVRGLVPKPGPNGNLTFKPQNKVLLELADRAKKNLNNEEETTRIYFLIIDEINRANLPAVLGELIYALEYRDEEVDCLYPESFDDDGEGNRKITLPSNLYIIGTMNTADRSVGTLDYAIRRRFVFEHLSPDREVIPTKEGQNLFDNIGKIFVSIRAFAS